MFFFFQAEDGIRDYDVTGVQTCALPIFWVITDEVYDRIIYDQPHVSFLGAGYDDVVMIQSFSKTFAMTGWRMGYILSANSAIMEQVTKLQYYITACSTDAMQYGVLAAIEQAPDYPSDMRDAFRQRRDLICARMNTMPGVSCHLPEGAFYVFPKVDVPGWTSVDIALERSEERRVGKECRSRWSPYH